MQVGDEIVTSGLGGRFPAGFPVGKVSELHPDDTHAFLVGELTPAAKLDRGRDVLLLRAGKPLRVVPGAGSGESGDGIRNGNGNSVEAAAASAPASAPVTATPRTPAAGVSNTAIDPARPTAEAASGTGTAPRARSASTPAAPAAQPARAPASVRPSTTLARPRVERIQQPDSRSPSGFAAGRAGGGNREWQRRADASWPCERCAAAAEHRSYRFPTPDSQFPSGFAGDGPMTRMRNTWILPASFVIALVLGLLPLPLVVQPLRPYWLALVLAYWVIEEPDRVGLGIAFVAGVLADLLYGGLLGEQALRLVIMTFILQRFRARMRFFPVSQQALAIGGLLLNDRIVSSAVHLAVGEPTLPWSYWWAPLLGMALWPPLFVLLDAVRLGKRSKK